MESKVRDSFNSLVAPFDLAIVFLTIGAGVIFATWGENKGDSSGITATLRTDGRSKVKVALDTMTQDPKIALLGMTQSFFEGAMYIFVFMWTPKMEPLFENLPHGQVFGCFMACMMIGSSLTKYMQQFRGLPAFYLRELFAIGAVCLGLPAMGGTNKYVVVVCFFLFEIVCGIYWPSMGIVKSKYVPEEVRATIYNIFRVPLNLIVVLVLANLGTISDDVVFCICAFLLGGAAFMQHLFFQMVGSKTGDAAKPSDRAPVSEGDPPGEGMTVPFAAVVLQHESCLTAERRPFA
mmetsp:Transcript_35556/g.55520  ORF Transcript_35556/g.55520 Transcript_35556/m.55520 type:complete len:292 (+) Transcript_35556:1-876(+)